jgi:hypothetical protein
MVFERFNGEMMVAAAVHRGRPRLGHLLPAVDAGRKAARPG